jgi:hypothetical protein
MYSRIISRGRLTYMFWPVCRLPARPLAVSGRRRKPPSCSNHTPAAECDRFPLSEDSRIVMMTPVKPQRTISV